MDECFQKLSIMDLYFTQENILDEECISDFATCLDNFSTVLSRLGRNCLSEQRNIIGLKLGLIDTLLTYLPLSRIDDIQKYFNKNYEILRPKRSIIYIDTGRLTAKELEQLSIRPMIRQYTRPSYEIRLGGWTDRNLCLMQLLSDLQNDTEFDNLYIIDSDNLLESSFQETDSSMEEAGFSFYTVMDRADKRKRLLERSELIFSDKKLQVWRYKIFRRTWISPFFIGPKQGIRMNKQFVDSLNKTMIRSISDAMRSLEPNLRNFVTDETTLGMLLHYSGVGSTSWIRHGAHMQGPRPSHADYLLCALAFSRFGKSMMKRHNGLGIKWYYLRNKIALIARSITP